MSNNRNKDIDELREVMGTNPSSQPKKETKFFPGVSQVKVELRTWTNNPYKAIFDAATATWGDDKYESKWEKTSPQARLKVVVAALLGYTLPQALEPVMFMFKVTGASRSAFDQWARARLATFFSIGSRDNNKLDASFIIPNEMFEDNLPGEGLLGEVEDLVMKIKEVYQKIINKGHGSWQTARCILPMGYHHQFFFSINFASLKSQLANRLKFCEQEDTVAIAWSIRKAIGEEFPLLAKAIRPGCDYAKKCLYHKAYSLSEQFGCLFAGCKRWPDEKQYSTFNKSCSDIKKIEEQTGIGIPEGDELLLSDDITIYDLSKGDADIFSE